VVVATNTALEAEVEKIISVSIHPRSQGENTTLPRFIKCKNNLTMQDIMLMIGLIQAWQMATGVLC
jgi:hypothetical protein